MAQFFSPDAIVGCYENLASFKSRGKDEVNIADLFFLNVDNHKSINGGLGKGGKELFEGDISSVGSTSKFRATLSNDSFELVKIVNSKNGAGYIIKFVGKSTGYVNSYFGDYLVINAANNKVVPVRGGSFQVSLDGLLKKYDIN